MMTVQVDFAEKNVRAKYEMVPPEGGWGYVVTVGVSLIFIAGAVPYSVFGAVFGDFLADLGDEISATTLINGVSSTAAFLAGLPAAYLLQKYTYRQVGLIGATIYFVGCFFTIFTQSVFGMIVTYGVLQGLGFGLILPAGFSAFNEYFVTRRNVVMSIGQTLIGVVGMVFPAVTSILMREYGFRGTAAIFCAYSLHLVLAACTFQPVKWHCKLKLISDAVELETLKSNDKPQVAASTELNEIDAMLKENENYTEKSIRSSNENTSKRVSKWQKLVEVLDLTLFKDPSYIILTIGVSMARSAEIIFLSVIPLLLSTHGYDETDSTVIFTAFFAADLAGRIFLSIINGLFQISNRYVFLAGSLFSAIFLIAFTVNATFWWTITASSALGFLRSFVQIPFSLVFAEEYGPRFKTAFSLNMAVCGCIILLIGVLSGCVKDITGSDIMVVYLLVITYLMCAIPWLVEILVLKIIRRKTS